MESTLRGVVNELYRTAPDMKACMRGFFCYMQSGLGQACFLLR